MAHVRGSIFEPYTNVHVIEPSSEVHVSHEVVCESCEVLQFWRIVYYRRVKGYYRRVKGYHRQKREEHAMSRSSSTSSSEKFVSSSWGHVATKIEQIFIIQDLLV